MRNKDTIKILNDMLNPDNDYQLEDYEASALHIAIKCLEEHNVTHQLCGNCKWYKGKYESDTGYCELRCFQTHPLNSGTLSSVCKGGWMKE